MHSTMSEHRPRQLTTLVIRQQPIVTGMETRLELRRHLRITLAIRRRLIVTDMETLLVHLQHPQIILVIQRLLIVIVMATPQVQPDQILTISGIPIPPILTDMGIPLEPHRVQRITLATQQPPIVIVMDRYKAAQHHLLITSEIAIPSSVATILTQPFGVGKDIDYEKDYSNGTNMPNGNHQSGSSLRLRFLVKDAHKRFV